MEIKESKTTFLQPMMHQAKSLLKSVFGYDTFRPLQAEIIENVLNKKDTLVVMPTGGGKSICYQIPALIFDGLTVVVSPLISLMKDQVEQLLEAGVKAVLLNSTLSAEQYSTNIHCLKNQQAKLLYVAPETLLKPNILSLLASLQVDCLTIDEAHCISEWGHDFRPEYRKLADVRRKFSNAVCVALTATATPRVQDDICSSLEFKVSNKFVASFNRENLFIQVVRKQNPDRQILAFLEKFNHQSGIIYCFSRKRVEALADFLDSRGFSIKPYHAGLSEAERKQNQELFIRDEVQIIVATIAFGMGINKPNVRFILHADLPKSIESYYQEIGRAGRDGLRADCLLLYSYGDTRKIKYFIDLKEDELQRQVAQYHLDRLVDFAETQHCRRAPLIRYFGEEYSKDNCELCDNCTAEAQERVDLTVPAQKLLSCVYRTNQIFGSAHIIDVLRGSNSQKILKFSHHNLSTYGIGKEFSKKQWSHLARQFLRQGLLMKDTQYGSLKLTKEAAEVMAGNKKVYGMLLEEQVEYARGKDTHHDYDKILFEHLRNKRKELAVKSNVPPYVIFSDKTLVDMATYYPQSERGLLQMHGVGVSKMEKYGTIFLKIIRAYCREKNISERLDETNEAPSQNHPRASSSLPRYFAVGDAFNAGKSVDELARTYGVTQQTILDHIYRYYQAGYPLRADGIISLSRLSRDQQKQIIRIFDKEGTQRLRPVFEALNEQVPYEELKILRLYYLNR